MASKGSRGKPSSTHFSSCRHATSGCACLNQDVTVSIRALIELTFQVAIRIDGPLFEREALSRTPPAWQGQGVNVGGLGAYDQEVGSHLARRGHGRLARTVVVS